MNTLFIDFVTHPFADIAILLSLGAATAFAIFLWGFTGYILAHEHAEHQAHASTSITWGFFWLLALFVVWEIVRLIAGH